MDKSIYNFIQDEYDKEIVKYVTCNRCWEEFPIYKEDLEFLNSISPVVWDKKFQLSEPKTCFECRRINRFMFRNENKLHKNISSNDWKPLISVYMPESNVKIISRQEYYNHDLIKKDQYQNLLDLENNLIDLYKNTPHANLVNWPNMENSEYNNLSNNLVNCYLCIDCWESQNLQYSWFISWNSTNSIDCFDWMESNNCYEVMWFNNVSNSFFCTDISWTYDCYFCLFCDGISSCIWCYWLSNWRHMIFNEKKTEQEYNEFKQKYFNWSKKSLEEFRVLFKGFINSVYFPNIISINCNNVVWSDFLDSKNIFLSNFIYFSEDIRYSFYNAKLKDSMDADFSVLWCSRLYNTITTVRSSFLVSCVEMTDSNNCMYCMSCLWCSNCFWCVWLSNKSYCIYNVEYDKDERIKFVSWIIQSLIDKWVFWYFFDSSLSFYPYNDTLASFYYPINKCITDVWESETLFGDWKWLVKIPNKATLLVNWKLDLWWNEPFYVLWRTKEEEIKVPPSLEQVKWEDVRDNINDVDETIVNKAIICNISWRPFRVTKTELEFYKKFNLPLPTIHPDYRYKHRLDARNATKFFIRESLKDWKKYLTKYKHENIISTSDFVNMYY